ncbi:MAG: hypothetical protein V4529_17105 [Gemmatimonadota bacterium]
MFKRCRNKSLPKGFYLSSVISNSANTAARFGEVDRVQQACSLPFQQLALAHGERGGGVSAS